MQTDEEEIRRVLYTYCRGVDRADVEILRSVYHPDAIDDHGSFRLVAAEAIERIIESVRRTKSSQHNLTNILVQVDGDYASSEAYANCQLLEYSPGGDRLRMLGLRYLDRFERRNGEWRIANRLVVHDWSVCLPTQEVWARAHLLRQGSRDRTDPVYEL
tara:strand:+ start:709 stop:1185 length:477 start_codon:yes stop_codon:yes gene_type:complete